MNTVPINGLGRAESPPPAASSSSRRMPTAQSTTTSTPAPAPDMGERVMISVLASEPRSDTSAGTSENRSKDTSFQDALAERVRSINEHMRQQSTQLEFSIDGDTSSIVVKVLNKETGEVVRQIPPEELLNLTKSFQNLRGLMVSEVS